MPPVFAFVGTAVTSGLGTALGLSGWAATIANVGGSLLLQAGARALAKRGNSAGIAARQVAVRAPISPRDMVYGRVRTGGVIVYLATSGADSAGGTGVMHLVIVLAGHSCAGIDEIYFDGELAFDADGVAQGRFAGFASVEKRLGAVPQAAFTGPQVTGEWTADHRLDGCTAIALRLVANSNVFANGIPGVSAIVRGRDTILDPRTGTRGWTDNAALCLADYMADTEFGIGAEIGSPLGIDADWLIGEANICDEDVPLAEGGTEPRYTINGVIDTSLDPKAIIESLLTAMAGQAIRSQGVWRILSGAYRTPEVTLTEDDASGALKLITRLTRSTNFNGVRGTFVSPANDWQPDDFPAVASAVYLAEDSGRRSWRDLTLPFTTSASAAQRIAKITLELARRQMAVDWPGHLSGLPVQAGDCVALDRARWGFADKPFVVAGLSLTGVRDGIGLVPVLRLSETSPLVYSWEATEEQIYAAAPRSNLPGPWDVAAPGIVSVTESLYATRAGDGVKARALIVWTARDPARNAAYEVEGNRDGTGWVRLADTSATEALIDDIAPGIWEFRVRAVTRLGVRSDWGVYQREIYGLLQPPAALTGASIQSAGGLAVLKWGVPADLDVRIGGRIVIRHSAETGATSWANSVAMDEVPGNSTIAVVSLLSGSYLLRAVDSTGIAGPITVLDSDGAQAIPFVPADLLQADPLFPGDHAGTMPDTGALTLAETGLFDDRPGLVDDWMDWDFAFGVATSGTYTFAATADLGGVKTVRARALVTVETVALHDLFDLREGLVDSWPDWDGATGAQCDVEVQVRVTQDDPAGSPSWGDWRRITATDIVARGVQARAILRTADKYFTPRVTALRVTLDEVA